MSTLLLRESISKAETNVAGQLRAEQGRAGQGRAGQGRAGQGRAGQGDMHIQVKQTQCSGQGYSAKQLTLSTAMSIVTHMIASSCST